jgi:hypothetical protein
MENTRWNVVIGVEIPCKKKEKKKTLRKKTPTNTASHSLKYLQVGRDMWWKGKCYEYKYH